MWKNWDKANEKLKEENTKFKFLLKECKELIEALVKQNQDLNKQLEVQKPEKPQSTRPLKPTTGLRFKIKLVNTFENKFGAATHGTKEINILQQWYSVSGFEDDTDGEWRDVTTSGSLY